MSGESKPTLMPFAAHAFPLRETMPVVPVPGDRPEKEAVLVGHDE